MGDQYLDNFIPAGVSRPVKGGVSIDIPGIGIRTVLNQPFDNITGGPVGRIMQKGTVSIVFAVDQSFVFQQHLFDAIEVILSGGSDDIFLCKQHECDHENNKQA